VALYTVYIPEPETLVPGLQLVRETAAEPHYRILPLDLHSFSFTSAFYYVDVGLLQSSGNSEPCFKIKRDSATRFSISGLFQRSSPSGPWFTI
jgi:hypothetical protein